MTTARRPSFRELYDAAHFLYELHHAFGAGEANKVSFSTWQGRFASEKTQDAARRHWERLKWTFEAMSAPVERQRDGKDVYLVLGGESKAFALTVLNALAKHAPKGVGELVAQSHFEEVHVEDVDLQGWEPDAGELESMKVSLETCPLGLINPIVLVGEAPPFQVGLGKVRFAACRELGRERVIAQVVKTWDPTIEIHEDYVRRHHAQADVDLRHAEIAALKGVGLSNRKVASELGVCEKTVRNCSGAENSAPERVVGSDEKTYPSSRLKPVAISERRQEAKRLKAEEQLSTREIAAKLGVSLGTAHADLRAEASCDPAQPKREWHEIDPDVDPPKLCLAALERGVVQLNAALRAGTATVAQGRQLQRVCFAVSHRVRSGDFNLLAGPQLSAG